MQEQGQGGHADTSVWSKASVSAALLQALQGGRLKGRSDNSLHIVIVCRINSQAA